MADDLSVTEEMLNDKEMLFRLLSDIVERLGNEVAPLAASTLQEQISETVGTEGIKTFRQTTEPPLTNLLVIGDLWFDTDDADKPYRFDGVQWEPVRDGTIADAALTATWANVAATPNAPEDNATLNNGALADLDEVGDAQIAAGTQITEAGITTSTTGQRIAITEAGDELEFYGDRGDTTVSQIASIGIAGISGVDNIIADFGSIASGYTKNALRAASISGIAGEFKTNAVGGTGVNVTTGAGGTGIDVTMGTVENDGHVGLRITLTNFGTNYANRTHITMVPHPDVTGAPSNADGANGSLLVESGGDLYFKKAGTWQKLSV